MPDLITHNQILTPPPCVLAWLARVPNAMLHAVICTLPNMTLSQCCSIARFKICATVQVKSEDLRIFVEVLQSLNPEPADMLQLRTSEAQLRNKVAKLQAEADGHNLQQTVKQLQQAEVNLKALSAFTPVCSAMPVVSHFQHISIFCCKEYALCSCCLTQCVVGAAFNTFWHQVVVICIGQTVYP